MKKKISYRERGDSFGPSEVADSCRELGRELTREQAEGLAVYLDLLVRWNSVMNLVGPDSPRDILRTLVVDSWHLADLLAEPPAGLSLPDSPRTLDLGAGGGLPGIPLRLFWTAGEYWLVEAREKRAAFLQNAVARLGLKRTSVFGGRVEHLPAHLCPADIVLSRAFMPWRDFLDTALPLLGERGAVVVLASGPPEAESHGGLVLSAVRSYPAAGSERYFWVFTPASISR